MNRVLVAGATGYLGKYIVKNLVERKVNTTALIRPAATFSQTDLPVELLRAEVTDARTLINCCDGIDTVISTIGITRQTDGLSYIPITLQVGG